MHYTNHILSKYSQMGYHPSQIEAAWAQSNYDERTLQELLFNNKSNESSNPKPEPSITKSHSSWQWPNLFGRKTTESRDNFYYQGNSNQQYNDNRSQNLKQFNEAYEPLNPEQRLRKSGVPIGLKNVGNTCYVNSLFQTYFMSQKFVSAILNYDPKVSIVEDLTGSVLSKGNSDLKRRRIEASIELVKCLQRLFALMIKSHKKYLDPTDVLKAVVDDAGKRVLVGEQQDVTEYHLNLLARVEEAFFFQEKYLSMKDVVERRYTRVAKEMKEPERKESVSVKSQSFVKKLFSSSKVKEETKDLDQSVQIIEDLSSPEISTVPLPEDIEETPEEAMKMSLKKVDSEPPKEKQQKESLIKNHFFGKMKEYRTYEQNGEQVTQDVTDFTFGPLIMDISSNKELYEGLENYCNYPIEGFRAPNGQAAKAQQELWIEKPPEFLVFQLNRVSYNLRNGMAEKVNKPFRFEKEIYLDRFMLEYREEASKLNETIRAIKAKVEQEEKKLLSLSNFFGSTMSVPDVLSNAEGFLNAQINPTPEQVADILLPSEFTSEQLCDEQEIETAMKVLRTYRKRFEQQIKELVESIKLGKAEIEALNNSMNKHKYHLAAILIHDGMAGQGHYYSFNRNVANNTWKRFNDINVTPETEQNVLREALGGYGNASAYCLVYLSDNMVAEELASLEYGSALLTPGEFSVEREHYSGLLPMHLLEYVEGDNSVFYNQIEEFKFNKYLTYSMNIYRDRYNLIERVTRGKSANRLVGLLDSFATFLKAESHSERLLKWYLLDTSLKESGTCMQFRELDDPYKLGKIQDKVSLLDKQYTFRDMLLTKEEKIELDVKLAKYMELYPFTVCYKFVIKAFMTRRYIDACYGIRRLLFMSKSHKICTTKPLMDIIEVVVLRFALECEKLIVRNQLKELVFFSDILVALLKGTLKATDVHSLQVKQILNDGLKDAATRIPHHEFIPLNNEVHKVLNPLHTISELEKPIKDYKCEELENELERALFEDIYGWRDIQCSGPSFELGKLMNEFSTAYRLCVGFHHYLKDEKTVLTYEERESLNYIAR